MSNNYFADIWNPLINRSVNALADKAQGVNNELPGYMSPTSNPFSSVSSMAQSAKPIVGISDPTIQYPDRVKSGGSRSWRNNNPANMIDGPFARSRGSIGKDRDGFAIFPDVETGKRAQEELLRRYGDYTVEDMIEKYAPATDGNSPERYKAYLEKHGVDRKKKVGEQMEPLSKWMTIFEGWREGNIRRK